MGTLVAGPIGMVIGYKLAAIAAIGTTAMGYATGKVVQKFASPPGLPMIVSASTPLNSNTIKKSAEEDEECSSN